MSRRDNAPAQSRKLIAIVLPTLSGGGVERVRIELARYFIDAGYDVEFVLLKATGELLTDIPDTTRVVALNTSIRSAILPLTLYFAKRQPNAILAAMWPLTGIALIAASLARSAATIVVSEHTHLSKSGHQGIASKLLLRLLGRPIYGRADAVVCVSNGVRKDLGAILGLPEEKLQLIYNPVRQDSSAARIADEKLEAWWKRSTNRVLAAGRLSTQKDYATLLRAMSLIRQRADVRLTILGEGPERPALERLIAELSLTEHVKLAGFVEDVRPFLAEASLFVLSSKWEGLGNVITEALVQGVPVVSTDCPSGPAELLEEGRYGILVPTEDACALANAMLSSLTNTHDRQALRDRGKQFHPASAADQYLRLLDPAYVPPAELESR